MLDLVDSLAGLVGNRLEPTQTSMAQCDFSEGELYGTDKPRHQLTASVRGETIFQRMPHTCCTTSVESSDKSLVATLIRSVGRDTNPEQFHLFVFGNPRT